jgi:hypothetical protein
MSLVTSTTPFPGILRPVEPDAHAVGDLAAFIDDGAANLAAGADEHVRQDDGALDGRALFHAHVGEEERLAHERAGDDAAAGDHGIDGHAAPTLLIEHEFGRRLVQLVGPDGPVLVVDVELRPDMHQLEVGLVIRVQRADVAPVALRASLDVLERVREHLQRAGERLGDDVLAEIVRGRIVGRVLLEQALQQPRIEDVDAHRRENGVGPARQGIGNRGFLREPGHAIPLRGREHAEVARVARRHLDHPDRDVGALLHVVGDHRAIVHLVDVIPRKHEHVLGPVREDELDVLVNGVGRAAVPDRAFLLLRRDGLDELAELAAQVAPAPLHVRDQGLRLVLGEDGNLPDTGIDAVREHEIDDAELAPERRRGLAAMLGQILQPLAAPTGHDHGESAACQAAYVASGRGARRLSGHEDCASGVLSAHLIAGAG